MSINSDEYRIRVNDKNKSTFVGLLFVVGAFLLALNLFSVSPFIAFIVFIVMFAIGKSFIFQWVNFYEHVDINRNIPEIPFDNFKT